MSKKENCYHIPALFTESIHGLNIHPSGTYVDVTFGGGGHARGILEQLGPKGKLYGFDQDLEAEANIPNDARFRFVRSNFRYLSNFLKYYHEEAVDGILADLGVSFHHFDDESRGFSFRNEGTLDMRMNNRKGISATDILNDYSEEQLADIFYHYGELRVARRLAARIVQARKEKAIDSVEELLSIVKPFIGREKEKKFLAQLFQALRIEVNDEMAALQELLQQSHQMLKRGGRLVVITYHSLEDRMVKQYLKTGNTEGRETRDLYGNRTKFFTLINNKVITATAEEIAANPRARSAKLRIAEKRDEE